MCEDEDDIRWRCKREQSGSLMMKMLEPQTVRWLHAHKHPKVPSDETPVQTPHGPGRGEGQHRGHQGICHKLFPY